jgi:hypothetical protein
VVTNNSVTIIRPRYDHEERQVLKLQPTVTPESDTQAHLPRKEFDQVTSKSKTQHQTVTHLAYQFQTSEQLRKYWTT